MWNPLRTAALGRRWGGLIQILIPAELFIALYLLYIPKRMRPVHHGEVIPWSHYQNSSFFSCCLDLSVGCGCNARPGSCHRFCGGCRGLGPLCRERLTDSGTIPLSRHLDSHSPRTE